MKRGTVRASSRVLGAALVAGVWASAAGGAEWDADAVRSRCASLSTALRIEIAALQYVLKPDELTDLLSNPREDACRRWIDRFWAARDPVCTTRDNEARIEHENRVEKALHTFRIPGWPGWDQRGEVYIRYGTPSARQILPAGVEFEGQTAPEEFWVYSADDMCVLFVDARSSGEYRYYLEDASGPADRARSDRRNIASKYLPDGDMRVDIDQTQGGMLDAGAPPDLIAASGYERYRKMVLRFPEVMEKKPSVSVFELEDARLPLSYAVQCFRGGESVDRVDVNAEYAIGPVKGSDLAPSRYTTTVVLWDSDGKEVARRSRVDEVTPSAATVDSSRSMVTQLAFTLPPAFYQVGITVKEGGTGRFFSQRDDVTCADFEKWLSLSDVSLAGRIGPARENSPFNRGALEVVPHPSRGYRLAATVPVYFEVYNLRADAGGTHRYTVEYGITPRTPRPRNWFKSLTRGTEDPTQVKSSFQGTSRESQDFVHVLLKTRNLWPGEFLLEVAVVDDVSMARVSREVVFRLEE